MAFSLKYLLRGPSVEEERDWERENIRQKRARYLATNPLDRFATDEGYRHKVELTQSSLEGIRGPILDLGGNTAGEAIILQQRGFDMIVADINEYALDLSRQRCEAFGLKAPGYVALDAHRLPFRDGVFSAVTVLEALHHFTDYAAALSEIYRVLAPGGILFSIEPNAMNPLRRASEVRDRFRGTIEKSFYAGDLKRLCAAAGFESVEVQPFGSMRSEWKLQEVPPYRRPLARFHGWLCANYPTVFAAHRIIARKAGEQPVEFKAELATMLQSPVTGTPLEYCERQSGWVDRKSQTLYPVLNGIPVLIPNDGRPVSPESNASER